MLIRAKVSAEAIAEIINSFVEPISYKTLVNVATLIINPLMTNTNIRYFSHY